MVFKKFEELKIKKSKMNVLKGGNPATSSTEFVQTGVAETEQEVDDEGNPIGDPFVIDMPI